MTTNVSATSLNDFSDIHFCSPYFSRNTISDVDCIQAFAQLPLADKPKKFFNHAQPGMPFGLPLTVKHGTCAMKFETAGRSADKVDSVLFIPRKIGEMAEWVIDKCVRGQGAVGEGGYVTTGIANTENFLGNPSIDADFEGGFPTSTTFFNLLIWNPTVVDYSAFNAGDNDPHIGGTLEEYTRFAAEKQAPSSEGRAKLEERSGYIGNAVMHMSRTLGPGPKVNWWDHYPPASLGSLSLPGGHETDDACNGTVASALKASCNDSVRPVEAS